MLKRDYHIELTRIIACLMVIGVHIALPYRTDYGVNLGRLFFAIIVADGVAIFWMISGAFLFRTSQQKYITILVKTLKKILVPMLLWSIIWSIFQSLAISVSSGSNYFQVLADGISKGFTNLILWRNGFVGCGHLWYLYVYVLVMVCYPVLKPFSQYIENDRRIKTFLTILFLLIFWNDITRNQLFSFSHITINALVPASIEVVIGHILYKYHKEILIRIKRRGIFLLIFFLVNVGCTFIQSMRLASDRNDLSLMYWFSLRGIICSSCIMMFCLDYKASPSIQRIICIISSYTFTIYIIHYGVIYILEAIKFTTTLQSLLVQFHYSWFTSILYLAIMIIAVFSLSLVGAIFVRKVLGVFNKEKLGR